MASEFYSALLINEYSCRCDDLAESDKTGKISTYVKYPMLENQIFQSWNASTQPSSIPGKELATLLNIMSNARNVILGVILQYVKRDTVEVVLIHNPRCSKKHVTSAKLLGQYRQIIAHCEITEAASDETEFIGTFYILYLYIYIYITLNVKLNLCCCRHQYRRRT